jgi:hypothetical protein
MKEDRISRLSVLDVLIIIFLILGWKEGRQGVWVVLRGARRPEVHKRVVRHWNLAHGAIALLQPIIHNLKILSFYLLCM